MSNADRLNTWTHAIGALLAITGAGALLPLAMHDRNAGKLPGIVVYCVSLVLLYGSSAAYHGLGGRKRKYLQKLDHCSIYLLIAGTYTPFCLITLRGPIGVSLLVVIWTLAVLGIAQEFVSTGEKRVLSLVIYLAMGWAALAALPPLQQGLGPAGFTWVLAGGLLYTFGIVFYTLDARFWYAHGIWHLFVLAGSSAHFLAVCRYLV